MVSFQPTENQHAVTITFNYKGTTGQTVSVHECVSEAMLLHGNVT